MTTHRGAEQFLMRSHQVVGPSPEKRSPYRTLECWTTRLELTVMEPE
jgi:hypothetical protein